MQRLEVSGSVRPIYGSLGVKRLTAAGVNFLGVLYILTRLQYFYDVMYFSTKIYHILTPLGAFSQNYEKRLLASSRLSVRPSDGMEQFCSHWTDFHEI